METLFMKLLLGRERSSHYGIEKITMIEKLFQNYFLMETVDYMIRIEKGRSLPHRTTTTRFWTKTGSLQRTLTLFLLPSSILNGTHLKTRLQFQCKEELDHLEVQTLRTIMLLMSSKLFLEHQHIGKNTGMKSLPEWSSLEHFTSSSHFHQEKWSGLK